MSSTSIIIFVIKESVSALETLFSVRFCLAAHLDSGLLKSTALATNSLSAPLKKW